MRRLSCGFLSLGAFVLCCVCVAESPEQAVKIVEQALGISLDTPHGGSAPVSNKSAPSPQLTPGVLIDAAEERVQKVDAQSGAGTDSEAWVGREDDYRLFEAGRVLALRRQADISADSFFPASLDGVTDKSRSSAVRESLALAIGRDQELLQIAATNLESSASSLISVARDRAEDDSLRSQALDATMNIVLHGWHTALRKNVGVSDAKALRRPENYLEARAADTLREDEPVKEVHRLASQYWKDVIDIARTEDRFDVKATAFRCAYQVWNNVPFDDWQNASDELFDLRVAIAMSSEFPPEARARYLPTWQALQDFAKNSPEDAQRGVGLLRGVYIDREEDSYVRLSAMESALEIIVKGWHVLLLKDAEARQLPEERRDWRPEAIMAGQYSLATIPAASVESFQELADSYFGDLQAIHNDEDSHAAVRERARALVIPLRQSVPFARSDDALRFLGGPRGGD